MTSSRGYAVLVAGAPGVGKTTLLKDHVTAEVRDTAIVGSSILAEVLAPRTVQDLDAMPEAERATVRTEAIRRLRGTKRAAPGRVLVDGHLTLRNRLTGALDATFTKADAEFYDALVVVEAPANHVLTWRSHDARDRGQESVEAVLDHLRAERAEARRIANATGLPLLIVEAVPRSARVFALGAFLRLHAPLETT